MANLVRRLMVTTSGRGSLLPGEGSSRGFLAHRLLSVSSENTTTSSETDFPSQVPLAPLPPEELEMEALTPVKVVEMLDRYIVGQQEAKRAVAVALRNRWRRHRIPEAFREEIVPKNILMIGPTGCGKTEIARRLAKIAYAPFVKVEATKFTEVGFHGRDVDQIIRDLVDNAIALQRQKMRAKLVKEVENVVEARLLDIFISRQLPPVEVSPIETWPPALNIGQVGSASRVEGESPVPEARVDYEAFRQLYRDGALDNRKIQLDIPDGRSRLPLEIGGASGFGVNELVFRLPQMEKFLKSQRMERMEITIADAKPILREIEMEKRLNLDQITKDAIMLAESDGIVFIDEIDKIVTNHETRYGADASSEGVQRDLLPIIEGSVVSTKYGNVNTDHILFICSGAFHSCKPSDMLAELQGRLPIRVELKGLGREDLYRILTEPETNIIRQQQLLMKTEDIHLVFTDDAIEELAKVAAEVNRSVDNIGARRLHTVVERVVEDISFHAPERSGETYTIDKESVQRAVGDFLKKADLSRFVL
ncbi:uncharacterized protein [Physcomitrium patens]|nr:uncharacterized protein LOC112288336 isoform X1 [Physcomitrium patens]XP_024388209.1 uncharacterized protein LOC112288336 isoform X1 [Physcomitrium patens]|eukprot:XP_024388208.1 uncharacterized protein LOC112288336 isoform X1 [Physcomitrella patens]